jgi:hypothetical protein
MLLRSSILSCNLPLSSRYACAPYTRRVDIVTFLPLSYYP